MKKTEGLILRTIGGEHVIVSQDSDNINFSRIISMNETSAFLWNALNAEFDAEAMASLLTENYDVSYDEALADCIRLSEKWQNAGIVII